MQKQQRLPSAELQVVNVGATPALVEGVATMSLARVQNFSISLDGFGTGEG